MAELKKGRNFVIQGLTEKKICVRLFFVLMLHIKFQIPSSSSSLVLQQTKGVTDRWTDRQMVPNQYAPQLLQNGGIKNEQVFQMALLLFKENTCAKLF